MKDVIIVSPYIGKIDNQFQNRFLYLSRLLSSKGHKVTLITSLYCHTTKDKHSINSSLPFNVKYLDCGTYNNISFKRFFHNIFFAFKLYFFLKKINSSDTIVISAFPFLSSLISLALLRNSIFKIIVDIQDLWPESFVMLKPNFLPEFMFNIFLKPFFIANKFIFKLFDNYCFVSHTFMSYFDDFYLNDFNGHVCYIGVNPSVNIKNITYPINVCKLVYVGSLERSYDLLPFFESLILLNSDSNIRFELHVYGSGSNLNFYKSITADLNFIIFHKPVSVSILHKRINNCHIAINPIVTTSAASIINKHADYSIVGLPVINTQSNAEYKQLLQHYNAGLSIDLNKSEIIEAISLIISSEFVFSEFALGSRNMFTEFNREIIYEGYYEFLTKKNI